jgi:tRNA1Val (adenine37-N6)-methyltransferase
MPNSKFQFKKFNILQDKTAMKVGTDGVLLGAWAKLPSCGIALDVGTGTGLIALMMAQRNSNLIIKALEIDGDTAAQAIQNVESSPWNDRISVLHDSFQYFITIGKNNFDLIITNPPFFRNSVKSNHEPRSKARHADILPLETIIKGAKQLLKPDGTLAIVLPVAEHGAFSEIAHEYGFYEYRRLIVFPNLAKPSVRVLSQWGLTQINDTEIKELVIEPLHRHHYSVEYIMLTKEFYLKM